MIFIRLSFRIPAVSEIGVSSQQPLKYSVSGYKNFILCFTYGKWGKQGHNNKKFCIFELLLGFANDQINQIWSELVSPFLTGCPLLGQIWWDLLMASHREKMFNALTADFILSGTHSLSPDISLNQSQLCIFRSGLWQNPRTIPKIH